MFARDAADGPGRELERNLSYRGQAVLGCVPQPGGNLICRATAAPIIEPACWKSSKLPRNEIQVISSAKQLARFVACTSVKAAFDWTQTRLVLFHREVSSDEQLSFQIRYLQGRTLVVASIAKQCPEKLRVRQPSPTVRHHVRVLLPMLRDDAELHARVETPSADCGPRP